MEGSGQGGRGWFLCSGRWKKKVDHHPGCVEGGESGWGRGGQMKVYLV